jgi:DNA-binding transcriptional ArsR family regulator
MPPTGPVALLAALAELNRVKVVLLLRGGPRAVSAVAAGVGQPMAIVSHHLRLLDDAGVLVSAKEGRHVYYALNTEVYDPGGYGRPAALAVEAVRVRLLGGS